MFAVYLDKAHPHTADFDPNESFSDYHHSIFANNFLHGNGSKLNTINRWSDIVVQVDTHTHNKLTHIQHANTHTHMHTPSQACVSEDGGVGSILEHTGGDGPPAIAKDVFALNLK